MAVPKPTDGERRFANLQTAAKEAGMKLTHQRIEIFRELAMSDAHPDIETVFRAVQLRVPTVSLDTVYRTLWALHDLGLAATVGPRRGGIRFDGNVDPHHHFVCVRCGLVRDFQSDELDAVRIPRRVGGFGAILNAHIEVRGVCTGCQSRETPASEPEAHSPDAQRQSATRSKARPKPHPDLERAPLRGRPRRGRT
jgi:Fur family peroxide stress response transcriptional regulator